jgi:hypothetical protein
VSGEDDQGTDQGMVRLQVLIPRSWLARLHELARERAVSVSDVARILLRENLYEQPRRPS